MRGELDGRCRGVLRWPTTMETSYWARHWLAAAVEGFSAYLRSYSILWRTQLLGLDRRCELALARLGDADVAPLKAEVTGDAE